MQQNLHKMEYLFNDEWFSIKTHFKNLDIFIYLIYHNPRNEGEKLKMLMLGSYSI